MNISTLTYLFFSGLVVSTLSVNVIVDDADPRWSFSGAWGATTPSKPCRSCTIYPDPSRAFNHTWHDTSGSISSASLLFNGVSIQIYTICPPENGTSTYYTNFTFTLDNIGDGFFVGPIPSCSQFVYNYLVYARMNLTDGPHEFEITNYNLAISPSNHEISALLLDYAIYDDGTSVPAPTVTVTVTGNTSSSVPTGAIVATSVIAALLLIANLAQIFWHRRSKELQSHVGSDDPGTILPASPMQQQPLLLPVHPIPNTIPSPYSPERSGQPIPPSGLPSSRILNSVPETPMHAAPPSSENLSSVLKADAPPLYEPSWSRDVGSS